MKIKNGLKKCPRCKEKVLAHQKKCPFCGLVFERLNYVSNKSAHKEVIKMKRRNYIMVNDWPADVSKKTALLLCGFLGIVGAHNFYLGRFYKAITVLFGVVCSTILLFLDYGSLWHNIIFYISLVPAALVYVFWVLDFVKIFLEKYKIPVSIDNKLMEIKNEIITDTTEENNKNKKNKKRNKKNKLKNAENTADKGEENNLTNSENNLENKLENKENNVKIEENNIKNEENIENKNNN